MLYDKDIALNILERVRGAIEHIEERSRPYHCADDFLLNSMGVAILDSICMQCNYSAVVRRDSFWLASL